MGLRKNPHLPQFHKGPHVLRDAPIPKRRRAHGIMTSVKAPTPAMLASAAGRFRVYMHAARRRRLGL